MTYLWKDLIEVNPTPSFSFGVAPWFLEEADLKFVGGDVLLCVVLFGSASAGVLLVCGTPNQTW